LGEPKAVFNTHCVSKLPLINTKGDTITLVFLEDKCETLADIELSVFLSTQKVLKKGF